MLKHWDINWFRNYSAYIKQHREPSLSRFVRQISMNWFSLNAGYWFCFSNVHKFFIVFNVFIEISINWHVLVGWIVTKFLFLRFDIVWFIYYNHLYLASSPLISWYYEKIVIKCKCLLNNGLPSLIIVYLKRFTFLLWKY